MSANPTSGFSRRNFLGLSAAVGAAGFAAACGGGSSGPPGTQQGGGGEFTGTYDGPNVALAYWNGFTGGDGPFMKALVDKFNAANPNIKVTMNVYEWADYYQKV